MDILRDFSDYTRRAAGTTDRHDIAALEPFWCSWVDWASDDIDDEMVIENVRLGRDLGIRNFIIDDGWFGPGLDTKYSTPLNIGDWTPDSTKFPDMRNLVTQVKALGGRVIIWCAPHAVGPAARCYDERLALLLADADGHPVIGETQFFSLCFRSEKARRVMVDVCTRLAADYGFGGAKYDLFNWVPDVKCRSPYHEHDLDSMIEGLESMLRDADAAVRAVQPDYVVELKQNYGTALLTPYGSCMRAGDAPFDPRTNFLRTMHVQAYTSSALNDYQTFAPSDSPAAIAVAVITMLAAGIPAYGADFAQLNVPQKDVIRWYHELYASRRDAFVGHRTVLDTALSAIRATGATEDVIMLRGVADSVSLRRSATILNGSHGNRLHLDQVPAGTTLVVHDVDGTVVTTLTASGEGTTSIDVPVGGAIVASTQAAE